MQPFRRTFSIVDPASGFLHSIKTNRADKAAIGNHQQLLAWFRQMAKRAPRVRIEDGVWLGRLPGWCLVLEKTINLALQKGLILGVRIIAISGIHMPLSCCLNVHCLIAEAPVDFRSFDVPVMRDCKNGKTETVAAKKVSQPIFYFTMQVYCASASASLEAPLTARVHASPSVNSWSASGRTVLRPICFQQN